MAVYRFSGGRFFIQVLFISFAMVTRRPQNYIYSAYIRIYIIYNISCVIYSYDPVRVTRYSLCVQSSGRSRKNQLHTPSGDIQQSAVVNCNINIYIYVNLAQVLYRRRIDTYIRNYIVCQTSHEKNIIILQFPTSVMPTTTTTTKTLHRSNHHSVVKYIIRNVILKKKLPLKRIYTSSFIYMSTYIGFYVNPDPFVDRGEF